MATKETSGYPVIENLFNAVGQSLKPKVRCFIHPQNSGAGLPDGGFFTPDQLKNSDEQKPFLGVPLPSRGVVEIKATKDELEDIARTKQVEEYLDHYGLLLLTNFRDFRLLKRGKGGVPVHLEPFSLAPDEKTFWQTAAHPRKAANELGERFLEYLKRVLLHNAPLNNPKDVAFFLASYARDARVRVEAAKDLPALAAVRTALEEALGMKFEADKGEHFFRSTLVQTLFYGVFSAWVLWHKENPQRADEFEWKSAGWTLHVPMIKGLYHQIADPTKLRPLGLVEVLDWAAAALNRVDRAEFFARFVEDHAVQYFYEPFLEAFDPELRKELGVWYTPPEIVKYQVARVDAALREELEIPDGLADPRVFVLDPCCGTGAYLVEVLRTIEKTLREKGEDALANAEIREAAQKRVFGFEIMPAPFVVAHLQMGLLLQNLAVPLDDAKNERAGIFLTNALTGWDFAGENPQLKNWPELEAERAGAGKVKQDKPILVILGNPPYNGFAGVSPDEEQGLLNPYKQGLKAWGITKNYLDDLYVRFFRIAERRIAERTGKGIVSFISNHSWISDPSYVVVREHLLKSFDKLWIENLHGNRKISEYAPDGRTSETIFAMAGFSPGIQQGVATSLWVRTGSKHKQTKVLFRDDLNEAKAEERRAHLLQSLEARDFSKQYETVSPSHTNRFSFRPENVAAGYVTWPQVASLSETDPGLGLNENRGNSLHDFTESGIRQRFQAYFDPDISLAELGRLHPGLTTNAASFDAKAVRARLLKESAFDPNSIRPFWFKPFDLRWAYLERISNLWNRIRPELVGQAWKGNSFILARRHAPKSPDGAPLYFSRHVADQHVMHTDAYFIPLRLRTIQKQKAKKNDGNGEFGSILQEASPAYKSGDKTTANLSPSARAYLTKLGIKNPDDDADTAALIWMHALAIGYSPEYLAENADGIRQDWPRIPMPDSKAALLASAELGKQVAALLDTDSPLTGVTAGKIRPELVKIAVVTRLTKQPLNLSVTAGWGHGGKGGVTMPGKGKLITSIPAPDLDKNFPWKKLYDVYLNESCCWKDVPAEVWAFTIGGYQIIKKWLSYREFDLLGRALTPDEAREVTHMARRIAALILLQPTLDENYQQIKSNCYPWTP